MTPSQRQAIDRFRRHVEKDLDKTPDRGDQITAWQEHEYSSFVSVTCQTQMLGLPETNLLRIVSGQWWHVFVGKRGKITVKACPYSYRQFDKETAFGMEFSL